MSAAMAENPVRVLMVLTVRCAKNGIANSVLNYVSRLDAARVRCDLASLNEPDREARSLFEQTGGQVFVLGGRNRNPLGYIRAMSKIVRRREIEVVHAHGNSATLFAEMFAAKRGGAKVRIAHSHNTTCRMKWTDRLLRRPFYKACTNAVACSEAAGNWLFPNRAYELLNNAVRTEEFRFDPHKRETTRGALDLTDGSFAVLHVGTFNEQKNQAFLIDAFSEMLKRKPEAVLLLVGDGENRASCEALADRLGISRKVRFLGWREDIPALLSTADAFALPSRHEGLPLTLVEAQCAGLWCLASDRVTKEAALTPLVAFCPIGDAGTFAGALCSPADTDRAEASNDAITRLRTAGYDVSDNAERLTRLYERLTDRT